MPKKSLKLDKFDRKILYELDKDARTTTADIGRKIKRSKQFVNYRIKRLEKEKVIQGYVTVIDHGRLGYKSFRIYFNFRKLSPEKQEQLIDELAADKENWWLVTLEGRWEVGYAVGVKDVLKFYDYWDRIMEKYREYISERSVVVYSHIQQYPKAYLAEKQNEDEGTLVWSESKEVPLDELDRKLLKLISSNANMPLLELARKLGTSPQVIKGRMKRLEQEKVIQGYRALIDVSFLGYRYYKAYINFISTERKKELEQYCRQHPNILSVDRVIGGKDFEIELQARSFDEFDEIMKELRKEFEGMIDDYEFVIAREEKKMLYYPFED